jgi:hypothetical protein
MKFGIILIEDSKQVLVYEWGVIPNVGDKLSLSEKQIFVVKERLLPTSNSNTVVLFGLVF